MSHRQIINRTAAALATDEGWVFPAGLDFVGLLSESQDKISQEMTAHKHRVRALHFLSLAEVAFEAITGDRPDYDGTEDEKSE